MAYQLKTGLVIAGFMAAATALPEVAWAELDFCNDTPVSASVAIGYMGDQDWTSEGWWIVEPGECATAVVSPKPDSYYYWHALNENGEYASENYYFCSTDEVFTIVGDTNCDARGHDRVSFNEIRIDGNGFAEVRLTAAVAPDAPPPRKSPDVEADTSTAEPQASDDLTADSAYDFPLIKSTMMGEWRDKNNRPMTMLIDNDKFEDQFLGVVAGTAKWRLANTCDGADGQGPVMLVEYEGGSYGTLCWIILGLNDEAMMLRPVNRTEVMEFIRD